MVNSINGDLASYLAYLQSQNQSPTPQSAAASPATPSAANGQNSAYTLSLGQQQTDSSLLGYSSLGKLVNQVSSALGSMDSLDPPVTASMGNGSPLQQNFAVSVTSLAQAQTVTSPIYASADQSVIPPGILTVQAGSISPDSGSFVSSANPVTVTITDGSLNGVAGAINAAKNGITATVVAAAGGGYQLQLTGETGAAAGFSLSGIPALAYDPSNPAGSSVTETQSAADAQFSVDGGPTLTSQSNSGVAIAQGITADFTTTGAMTVSVPFGLAQANGAAQTLVSNVNALISGMGYMTGSGGPLSGDTGVAGGLGKAIDQVLGQSFAAGTLAGIGITTQSDGSLAVDSAALQSAYGKDPNGTRAVLDQASTAVRTALSSGAGAAGQIHSQMQVLAASLTQTTSLLSYLDGSASGQGTTPSLSDLLGGASQANPFQAALTGSGQSATTLGGTSTTGSGANSLAAELAAMQATQSGGSSIS